jgi:beta-1,2-mannobiose phosphorylase / 1,2-beta-oligomannan phosphorylase
MSARVRPAQSALDPEGPAMTTSMPGAPRDPAGPGAQASGLPFALTRRGVALRPDPADPRERGGVLNPAAIGRDGVTYLFYRAVAAEPANYSRILVATCRLKPDGRIETTRLPRAALEPEAPYERWADGQGGGVEDPRITPLEGAYYLAYTAYGAVGGVVAPRIALARSVDLAGWERLGLARFAPLAVEVHGARTEVDLDATPNKDAILFPERIGGRYAMLHRPMFAPATGLPQSIWLSWSDDLREWDSHQLVLAPALPWENLKVGGGTPPLRTPHGWLTFYHGVQGQADSDPARRYYAGALLLDLDDPARVLYQSPEPVLAPQTAEETEGVVSNVVFPCGVVQQPDGRLDVYYGMADRAIGLATTTLPAPDAWPV